MILILPSAKPGSTSLPGCAMPSVYDLHLRTTSLRDPPPPAPRRAAGRAGGIPRAGETSGERRLRLLRTVLGETRTQGDAVA